MSIRHTIAKSDHRFARAIRGAYRARRSFSVPAPKVIVLPVLWVYLTVRGIYHTFRRVFICEPMLKAYCRQYGKRLRTDIYIHWISGGGDIILGDDVLIDGKCIIHFAATLAEKPILKIGDRSGLGHNCMLTIGKRIEIGNDCQIASDVWLFDSPGHPADPAQRLAGKAPTDKDVRPIKIADNVWIGRRCIIYPGVSIGEGSIISAGSVVMQDIPANTMAAGNPARKVGVVATAALDRLQEPPSQTTKPLAGAKLDMIERSASLGG